MFSVFLVLFGFLASLSLTEARRYCGSYVTYGEYCYPDTYQESYCCGYNDDLCCYYTNVAALWWFWLLMVLLFIFFAIMITVICRRRRLRQGRQGYVVVRGQNFMPGTVVTRNNAQIAQVAPPGSVYAPYYGTAPPYQGYQDPNLGGESAYGYPPPYAPPNAPPTQKEY